MHWCSMIHLAQQHQTPTLQQVIHLEPSTCQSKKHLFKINRVEEKPSVIIKETKFVAAPVVDNQTQDQLEKYKEKNVKSISSA